VTLQTGVLFGVIIALLFVLALFLFYGFFLWRRLRFQQRKTVELEGKKQVEDLFKSVFSASPVGIALISIGDSVIYDVNDTLLELIEYSRESIVNSNIEELDIFEDYSDWMNMSSIVGIDFLVKDIQTEIKTRSGKIKWGKVSIQNLKLLDSKFLLLVVSDITKEKKLARLDELEIILLSDMATAKVAQKTNKGFCELMLSRLTKSFGLKMGAIRLFNKKTQKLELIATHNYDKKYFDDIDFDEDINNDAIITSTVAKTREPIFSGDIHADNVLVQYSSDVIGYKKIGAFVTYPLVGTSNQLIGVIAMWSDEVISNFFESKPLLERLLILFENGIERNLAQEELVESRQRYTDLFEQSNDVIFFHDLDGNILDSNPKAFEVFRYLRSELISGMKIQHIISDFKPGKSDSILKMFREKKKGQKARFNQSFITKDGKIVHTEVFSSFIVVDGKSIVFAIIRDITESWEMQQALKKSEEQYRHLYESAPVGLARIEIATDRFTKINTYGARLLGFDSPEKVLESGIGLQSSNYSKIDKSKLFKALSYKGNIQDLESTWTDKDGIKSHFLNSMKIYPEKGYIESSFVDITDRKFFEEALLYSEERFRNIVSSSPLGIHMFDVLGGELRFSESNSSAKKILNVIGSEGIGLKISEVYPYDSYPDLQKTFKDIAIDGGSWNGEIILQRDTKIGRRERILKYHAFQSTPNSVVAMFVSVTEKRRYEIIRAKMGRILEEKNKELEQLLYVTSHDLRSPLVNILGFSSELEDDLISLVKVIDNIDDIKIVRKKVEKIIGERLFESSLFIQKSAKKIDVLLRGLLRLSRIGRAPMSIENINMESMMNDIIATLKFKILEKDITLKISDIPNCNGDRDQLNQVFTNLLDNAIKYSRDDIKTMIKIYGNSTEDTVSYTIEDNGIGIRKEHQDKVFKIFHRLNPDVGTGFGLGMTIVQRIVLKHDGKIWIESEESVGTKVHVELPIDPDMNERIIEDE